MRQSFMEMVKPTEAEAYPQPAPGTVIKKAKPPNWLQKVLPGFNFRVIKDEPKLAVGFAAFGILAAVLLWKFYGPTFSSSSFYSETVTMVTEMDAAHGNDQAWKAFRSKHQPNSDRIRNQLTKEANNASPVKQSLLSVHKELQYLFVSPQESKAAERIKQIHFFLKEAEENVKKGSQ